MILNPTIVIPREFFDIVIQEHDTIGIIINLYYSKCLNLVTIMEFFTLFAYITFSHTDDNFTFYRVNVHTSISTIVNV